MLSLLRSSGEPLRPKQAAGFVEAKVWMINNLVRVDAKRSRPGQRPSVVGDEKTVY